nr:hypothetical protein [Nocardia nova]
MDTQTERLMLIGEAIEDRFVGIVECLGIEVRRRPRHEYPLARIDLLIADCARSRRRARQSSDRREVPQELLDRLRE